MIIYLTILAMAIVTFLIRFIPYAKADKMSFSPFLKRALSFTPVAVLTAIIIPGLLRNGGSSYVYDFTNVYLISGVFTFLMTYIFKHLLLTIVSAMALFLILKLVL